MNAFVIDVSACMPWCCDDERTEASEEMLESARQDSALHVPALWIWEILNAVGVAAKRKRISVDRGRDFLNSIAMLNLNIDSAPLPSEFPRLHAFAARHGLTAYDTAYLDLAKRLSLPLATLDIDLRRAALIEGLQVL